MPKIEFEADDELYQALVEEALAADVDIQEIVEAILTEALFEDDEDDSVPGAKAVDEGVIVDEDDQEKLEEGEET